MFVTVGGVSPAFPIGCPRRLGEGRVLTSGAVIGQGRLGEIGFLRIRAGRHPLRAARGRGVSLPYRFKLIIISHL